MDADYSSIYGYLETAKHTEKGGTFYTSRKQNLGSNNLLFTFNNVDLNKDEEYIRITLTTSTWAM